MTESAIVRQILDYLAAERIFAFRLNTSATKIGNRFFRSHGLGKGAADILALPMIRREWVFGSGIPDMIADSFVPHWVECKTSTGKQSPEQRSFQEHIESLGHKYVIARSVDDVAELWEVRGK